MSLVDRLMLWDKLDLAKSLGQHARENAELRNRVHELEHELFWMKAAERGETAAGVTVKRYQIAERLAAAAPPEGKE